MAAGHTYDIYSLCNIYTYIFGSAAFARASGALPAFAASAPKHVKTRANAALAVKMACSGLLECCQCARKGCSSLLQRRWCARDRRSGLPRRTRKHRYLSHGSHFGARNGRSGLPGCCWSALKGCSGPALAPPVRSKWPLWPALVPPVRSKRLLKPASMLPVRSKWPFWPALVPPVRSKSLFEPASVH